MTTAYVLGLLVLPALAYEGYVVATGDAATISQAIDQLTHATPFVTYVLGALVGHFAIQPPARYTLASRLSETAEVALVVWVGWGVYVAARSVEVVPWWGQASILLGGVILGAVAWTIGV